MLALITATAAGQSAAPAPPQAQPFENPDSSRLAPAPELLFDFKDSDIKFNLRTLMNILRDHNHEGWVLAAYPDPKTSRPLIGAGFSLDVEATAHEQSDPLNPDAFMEPSSAQLWQAAGLDADRLQQILDRFHRDLSAWTKKKYRRKTRKRTLAPELTDEEATRLLRISAIQAIHNARAYCRNFDQLTASQQMGLSQLVFQMGVNLEEFVNFLTAINGDDWYTDLSPPGDITTGGIKTDFEHWRTVQGTLIDSLWARTFTHRAVTVIAMFDPDYVTNPVAAEQRVEAVSNPGMHPAARPAADVHSKKTASRQGPGRRSRTSKLPRRNHRTSKHKR